MNSLLKHSLYEEKNSILGCRQDMVVTSEFPAKLSNKKGWNFRSPLRPFEHPPSWHSPPICSQSPLVSNTVVTGPRLPQLLRILTVKNPRMCFLSEQRSRVRSAAACGYAIQAPASSARLHRTKSGTCWRYDFSFVT